MELTNLTWIDAETTGVESSTDSLLEVACIVTDTDLNILDEQGYTAVVYYPEPVTEALKARSIELVQQMHDATGLWSKLPSGKLLSVIDTELQEYISGFSPKPKTTWLAGNSITLDRNFLSTYLPKSFEHLHHRSVDVTSIAGPSAWWKGVSFPKKRQHSAFDDIMESIEELKFLREKIFNWT